MILIKEDSIKQVLVRLICYVRRKGAKNPLRCIRLISCSGREKPWGV